MKQAILKTSLMALIVCLTLASCKKDNNPPDPNQNGNNNNGNNNNGNNNNSDTAVALNDLVNYYFVYKNPDGSLRAIYFFNDNGGVSAYRDGLGNRRGMENPALNGNVLSCTFGSVNYTFKFKKESNSNISLTSYTSSEGAYDNFQMFKVADAPVFASANATENIFNYTNNGNGVYLYFGYQNGNVWRYDCVNGPSNSMGYYLIGNNIGWKSNDDATFGVVVPNWAGNNNVKMLLQSNIQDLGAGVQTAFEY